MSTFDVTVSSSSGSGTSFVVVTCLLITSAASCAIGIVLDVAVVVLLTVALVNFKTRRLLFSNRNIGTDPGGSDGEIGILCERLQRCEAISRASRPVDAGIALIVLDAVVSLDGTDLRQND
jgi:hypothetical protein